MLIVRFKNNYIFSVCKTCEDYGFELRDETDDDWLVFHLFKFNPCYLDNSWSFG